MELFFNTIEGLAEEGRVDLDRSWQWLKAGFLTKNTEGFIMAAQEQALRTKGIKASIDKVEGEDGLCRLCGNAQESVRHIISICNELAKKQYLIRHDKMGSRIHWELCGSMASNVRINGSIMSQALCVLMTMAILSFSGIRRST